MSTVEHGDKTIPVMLSDQQEVITTRSVMASNLDGLIAGME